MSNIHIKYEEGKLYLELYKDCRFPMYKGGDGFQITIGDARGSYTLMGPSLSYGYSKYVSSVVLDKRDASEIRSYLDEYFPIEEVDEKV